MSVRYERLGEEVKKTLSEIIREMRDPRISEMTTVAHVELTNDLKFAKVRVSVYDKDNEVRKASVAALNGASGFIAREVGRRMDIRALPKFTFTLDESIEYSVYISKIIDSIHNNEKK
ncbi:MAG: 30S ribosome-binding factor RbfA [Clostridia bacterium]|nr:30S ribosome-binding factor RbfA [Clostridia bacterium]